VIQVGTKGCTNLTNSHDSCSFSLLLIYESPVEYEDPSEASLAMPSVFTVRDESVVGRREGSRSSFLAILGQAVLGRDVETGTRPGPRYPVRVPECCGGYPGPGYGYGYGSLERAEKCPGPRVPGSNPYPSRHL
jgi:hypothetical protein